MAPIMLAAALGVCGHGEAPVSAGESVSFAVVPPADYATFLVNWDDAQTPVFRAVIRTPQDYATIFRPAAVIGGRRPFAPPDRFFDDSVLLVVARVIGAPGADDRPLTVESLTMEGDAIVVSYRFEPPTGAATFTVKQPLLIRVPKRPLPLVRFVENGAPIGDLRPTDGAWAMPRPLDR